MVCLIGNWDYSSANVTNAIHDLNIFKTLTSPPEDIKAMTELVNSTNLGGEGNKMFKIIGKNQHKFLEDWFNYVREVKECAKT